MSFKDHNIDSTFDYDGVLYEQRPIIDPAGKQQLYQNSH